MSRINVREAEALEAKYREAGVFFEEQLDTVRDTVSAGGRFLTDEMLMRRIGLPPTFAAHIKVAPPLMPTRTQRRQIIQLVGRMEKVLSGEHPIQEMGRR